ESGVEDPVDAALLGKAKLDALDSAVLRHEHPDITGFRKVDEIPFDFERRRVSVVASRRDETVLVTKGAPEHVLGICAAYDAGEGEMPFTGEALGRARNAYEQLGREGYRVLAVAYAAVSARQPGAYSKHDEHDLVLAGLLAFADPPRADAGELLADLSRA